MHFPVPGTERPGRSPVYRHWRFQNKPLIERLHPSEQTFHDIFENSVARNPNRSCLGWRPWNPATKIWEPKFTWITYSQVAERRKNLEPAWSSCTSASESLPTSMALVSGPRTARSGRLLVSYISWRRAEPPFLLHIAGRT